MHCRDPRRVHGGHSRKWKMAPRRCLTNDARTKHGISALAGSGNNFNALPGEALENCRAWRGAVPQENTTVHISRSAGDVERADYKRVVQSASTWRNGKKLTLIRRRLDAFQQAVGLA